MLIQPTVGRGLHFHLSNLTPGFAGSPGEPFACILAGVNNDHSINVCVFDRVGRPFPKENVPLVHEGEDAPSGDYCAWMPFQTQTQKLLAVKADEQTAPAAEPDPAPSTPSADSAGTTTKRGLTKSRQNSALTGGGEALGIDPPEQTQPSEPAKDA